MDFHQMEYVRPDVEKIKNEIREFTLLLKKAESYRDAREVFLKKDAAKRHFSTLCTLVSIRHSIDTTDEFYDREEQFFNEQYPVIEEFEHEWEDALLSSPFKDDFSDEFGDIVFKNIEIRKKSFSPEIIPEMQKENKLVQEYEKLLASAKINFEGEVKTIPQMGSFKEDTDEKRRLAAWKAEGKWYKDNQSELDRLYDELVRVRHSMAKKLGYENYVPLGYYRMGRNCYDKSDVERFRSAVRDHLVPVAESMFREKAARFKKDYPMSFADNAVNFLSGEAKPIGDTKTIVENCRRFFDELSPETSEFFRTMIENGLMDLDSKKGKQGGGYCTELPDYGVPFIFANFNGTSDDVETLVHECGHAFAAWKNIDRIPSDTIWPTLDACEVHSMSMEFFCHPWAHLFYDSDTDKFLYSHLASSLAFIPYGTLVDHFQHCVYENPEWTPKERHDCWKNLLKIYMPWQKLDGEIPFYSEGEGWQRQHHIYSYPFYYIDYCLAQTVALQFWAAIRDDVRSAWKTYVDYTSLGGSKAFTELLRESGLESPFDDGCLKKISQKAEKYLAKFNLNGV